MVEKFMYAGCHRVERKCYNFSPRTIKEEMNKKASYLLRKKKLMNLYWIRLSSLWVMIYFPYCICSAEKNQEEQEWPHQRRGRRGPLHRHLICWWGWYLRFNILQSLLLQASEPSNIQTQTVGSSYRQLGVHWIYILLKNKIDKLK